MLAMNHRNVSPRREKYLCVPNHSFLAGKELQFPMVDMPRQQYILSELRKAIVVYIMRRCLAHRLERKVGGNTHTAHVVCARIYHT